MKAIPPISGEIQTPTQPCNKPPSFCKGLDGGGFLLEPVPRLPVLPSSWQLWPSLRKKGAAPLPFSYEALSQVQSPSASRYLPNQISQHSLTSAKLTSPKPTPLNSLNTKLPQLHTHPKPPLEPPLLTRPLPSTSSLRCGTAWGRRRSPRCLSDLRFSGLRGVKVKHFRLFRL